MQWSSTLGRFFSVDLPFSRFCWNVLVFSCLSLSPFLIFYIALSPGFFTLLTSNGMALGRFLRQVLTNGLPVIFVINYTGFFAAAVFLRQTERRRLSHLLLDGLVRAFLFVGLHALIYVLSADLFASFGGDRVTALQVVGPTLERAFLFENISGVYLYSTLPGAFIVYLAVLQRRKEPTAATPASSTLGLNGVIALSLCVFVVLIVTLLTAGLTFILGRP